MTQQLPISTFLSTGFRSFSVYDCWTSIPSMIDGLKVSQRKAMWTVLNNPKTMTVEQLSALSASYTKYHHGATNMEGVIVGLAQDFPGSNNVNWLIPDGQFGNILKHKASSARYISTALHSNWRQWFRKDDDIITEFEIEDGEITEPRYFIPLAPTILLNGGNGIGTGYSCNIFQYNPTDIIENVKLAIAGKPLKEMVPFCNGYKGEIKKVNGQTIYTGSYERVNATCIRITQLPIGYDQEKYKEILVKLMEDGEIKLFDDDSTGEGWNITISASREWIKQHPDILMDKLKLTTKDSENFVVWDQNQRIRRFSGPEDLIQHFVDWRLTKFEERRLKQIKLLTEELAWLQEKRKFIEYFIQNSKTLVNLSKPDLYAALETSGFTSIERLMQIRVYNLTKEEIDKLDLEIITIESQIDALNNTTAQKMYLAELKSIKL